MTIKEYYVGSKKYYSCRIWYYKNGIKKSKYKQGFERKKDAERWGKKEKDRLESLELGADKVKVGDFLDSWIQRLEEKNRLSPTTLNGYKVNVRHAKRYIGNQIIGKVLRIDIQDMADSLSAEGLKKATVKYVVRTLHVAFNYAIEKKLRTDNPCTGIVVAEDEKPFEYRIYSAEHLAELIFKLREQEHWLYMPVLLASMRGLRRGEALGLRMSDIDFEKEVAYIRNNYVIVGGKVYNKKVKTKKSNAAIDISGFIIGEIKRIKEKNEREGRIMQYVCEVDGQLPDPTHLSRALKNFQIANGLPVCRFHDLRHTFAMLQLENGTDLQTLKELLRHSKIAVTEIYLHDDMKMKRAASAKMDKILNLHCDNIVTKTKKSM